MAVPRDSPLAGPEKKNERHHCDLIREDEVERLRKQYLEKVMP